MAFKDRLSRLKKEAKLTTDTLSERSGIPRGTLNKLLNGETRNPTAQTLHRLAYALGCPLEALCGKPDDIPGVYRLGSEKTSPREAVPVLPRRIPLLGSIACGTPIFCEESVEMTDCAVSGCDFALRAEGDSMIGARIRDGDLVLIRRQDDVDDGQIAAVIIDDHATLKRVYHVKGGLQLLSENPAYPPMLYLASEHDNVRILGRAVSLIASL